MALVSQNPVLFARSLHGNIAYGLGEQSREEVARAAERVGVDDFITGLSCGYDTGNDPPPPQSRHPIHI